MNYDLEVDSKNKIVKVTARCLLDQEIRKKILLTVSSQLAIHNYSKVIIDVTQSTFDPAESMVGAFDLTNYMRSICIKPQVKIAFIYTEAEYHRKYFENVAQSFGFNLQYFKSLNEATAWLNE